MSNHPGTTHSSLARVTIVEAEACHFCADAREVLDSFASLYPLEIVTIDARDPLGVELMQEHRAAMNPLVLVDGAFFSQGRLPRGKLQRLLDERVAAAVVTR